MTWPLMGCYAIFQGLAFESNLPRGRKYVGGSQHANKANSLESNHINFATVMPTIMTYPIVDE